MLFAHGLLRMLFFAEATLQAAFAAFGTIQNIKLIKEKGVSGQQQQRRPNSPGSLQRAPVSSVQLRSRVFHCLNMIAFLMICIDVATGPGWGQPGCSVEIHVRSISQCWG
jgi:hypothetical protein